MDIEKRPNVVLYAKKCKRMMLWDVYFHENQFIFDKVEHKILTVSSNLIQTLVENPEGLANSSTECLEISWMNSNTYYWSGNQYVFVPEWKLNDQCQFYSQLNQLISNLKFCNYVKITRPNIAQREDLFKYLLES